MRRLPVAPKVGDFANARPWVDTWLQIINERLHTNGIPTVPNTTAIPPDEWGIVRNDSNSNLSVVASDGSNVRGIEFPIATTVRFLAGVIRYSSGAWQIQSDAGHTPLGIASVTPVTLAYGDRLRVTFSNPASHVGSLILQPDNSLVRDGFLSAGGEVGTGAADFELFRNVGIKGGFFWNGASFTTQYGDTSWPFTVADIGGGVARVTHSKVYDSVMIPIVTQRAGYYVPTINNFGSTFFDVKFPVATMDSSCGCLFVRRGLDVVTPSDGYSNADGNFWLYGIMHV